MRAFLCAGLAAAMTSCSPFALRQAQGDAMGAALPARDAGAKRATSRIPIQHIVLVIQENRSFDDFFSTFPNADGTAGGYMENPSGTGDEYVPLQKVDLVGACDFGHSYRTVAIDYDGGKMDGFDLEGGGKKCPGAVGTKVYQYVDPTQLAPDWSIAQQYVLADHLFQTQGSGSFTAHQDLIAGSTLINQPKNTQSLVDFPSLRPWGCDAPPGTVTSLLVVRKGHVREEYQHGPFPCLTYPTLRDLLDAKYVSWKYYSPPEPYGTGSLWNAFNAIQAVREGPEWKTNIARTNVFFSDVTNGTLPSVSWIVPENPDSDHPGNHSDTGPSWVASIVNAVGASSYWQSTAVVIVWDDWGGLYDHEPPPFFDKWGGLGFRVPMMIVSPYARRTNPSQPGYVSHTQYEFGSILKFMEEVWGLGTLGTTDQRANSIIDCFNFAQPPHAFAAIRAKYSRSYFLHRRPSYLPVDTE
jgi:phospholipase C